MAPLTWLVTGCSSGFGEQFVHAILARGDKVIATGRHASARLQHLAVTGAAILDLDVSTESEVVEQTVKEALGIYGGIDVLVNNAGYMESCYIEELTYAPCNHEHFPLQEEHNGGCLVESLTAETSHLGIQSIIFEPGFFRTQAFSPATMRHRIPQIADYGALDDGIRGFLQGTYGTEVGDPRKAVERILDIVKGEGMAAGRGEIPIRLPLGRDGMEVLRLKSERTLELCRDWEGLITSTDI
ncbi:MAG: hypothetical protein Q9214_003667 [Letrouitia sp. 1 TL-2023]